jgi:hypothetical protein
MHVPTTTWQDEDEISQDDEIITGVEISHFQKEIPDHVGIPLALSQSFDKQLRYLGG